MFNGKTIITASLSLALLLASSTFAQDKGKGAAKGKPAASAKRSRKSGKYANQEISYRQTSPAASQSANNAAQTNAGQNKLKSSKPKQQNLLPYMEQSNRLHRPGNSKRR